MNHAPDGWPRRIRALWTSHRQLMETNEVYRLVLHAVAAVLLRQVSLKRLLLALIHAVVSAWTIRNQHHRELPGDQD